MTEENLAVVSLKFSRDPKKEDHIVYYGMLDVVDK